MNSNVSVMASNIYNTCLKLQNLSKTDAKHFNVLLDIFYQVTIVTARQKQVERINTQFLRGTDVLCFRILEHQDFDLALAERCFVRKG